MPRFTLTKNPIQSLSAASLRKLLKDKGGLVVAGCDAAELPEPVEYPLDAFAFPLTPPVCFLWSAAAFASLIVTSGVDLARKAAA